MKKLIIIVILSCSVFANLTAQNSLERDSLMNEEFERLERRLQFLKKGLFMHFLDELLESYYEKNDIEPFAEDSLCFERIYPLDFSGIIEFSIGTSFFLHLTYNSEEGKATYRAMFDQWHQKDYLTYYDIVIGEGWDLEQERNLKGEVLMLKALDFYESEDLEKYIDWIRQIVRNEIIEDYKTHQD